MNLISGLIDIVLHLDKYLGVLINNYGTLVYVILFFIILCETGLVVTPFLPGDSLVFAAAAFAAIGSLNIWILLISLSVAAILGDTINYNIGKHLGQRLLNRGDSRFIKREYIDKTNAYYDKYGGKTIVIARFIPIVRTFAPFVAGIGSMHYKQFITFNAIGGLLWVVTASLLGFFFGNIPFVANNFSLVIIAIILISILPAVIEVIKGRKNAEKSLN
ncbi:DedA family protein [Clostridium sardiniense]|uniref:DedA family protein n=1 Tax=Clostridium sardiniense TaxID=29369 RepID=A0ABS7KYT3_CLOSR|nr:DedA family protein [Clostridium sardiniense]MBY0755969.1 DedA family protein [Clostridium sardiniense]MDQ0460741.1 membrane-associated protein [Clostridium sardiniense]